MKTLLPLACLALMFSPIAARDWTNASGKVIQADLVEVTGNAGEEIVVLKGGKGQPYRVALKELSAADQAFVNESPAAAASKTNTAGATGAGAKAPSKFKEMLDGKLVALDGKRVSKYEMTEDPDFYAFYFSAHWCPPCRAFTPNLVSFYNEQPGKKKQFEIILVSSDKDQGQMEDYIKEDEMPWPAIAYRSVDRLKEIKKYAGNGIPCLVLVDREGNVLSDSYDGKTYLGPTKVMNDIPEMTAPK